MFRLGFRHCPLLPDISIRVQVQYVLRQFCLSIHLSVSLADCVIMIITIFIAVGYYYSAVSQKTPRALNNKNMSVSHTVL